MKGYLPQAESICFTSHRSYQKWSGLGQIKLIHFLLGSQHLFFRKVCQDNRKTLGKGLTQSDLDQLLQAFGSFYSNVSKITCNCLTTVIHTASSSSHAYLLNVSFSDQQLKLIRLSNFLKNVFGPKYFITQLLR